MKIYTKIAVAMAAVISFYPAHLVAHGAANEMVEMIYIKGADRKDIAKMDGVDNAFLEDIIMDKEDVTGPLACGLFRMEKGEPLVYEYTYPEAKIIIDGQTTISDGKTTVHARSGDVLFFPVGAKITFSAKRSGLGFYCGIRSADEV